MTKGRVAIPGRDDAALGVCDFFSSVVVCGRKARKSIWQEALPGSFDSAHKALCYAIDLRSASLRMTTLLGACNTAGWICRKHERSKKSQALGMTKGRVALPGGLPGSATTLPSVKDGLSRWAQPQVFQQVLVACVAAASVEYGIDTKQTHLPVTISLCPVKPA
jgi:hypothetical protein